MTSETLERNIDVTERLYEQMQTSANRLDALKDQLEQLPNKLKAEEPDCKTGSDCSVVVGRIQSVLSALHILMANITVNFCVSLQPDTPFPL